MTTSFKRSRSAIGLVFAAALFSLMNIGQASAAPFATVDCTNPAHVTTLNIPQAECEFLDDMSTQFSDTGWTKTNWDTLSDANTWGSIVTAGGVITEIQVGGSSLSGTIPASISNLPSLEVINITGSDLSGSIPGLSSNTALVTINLFNNDLSGNLPDISTLTLLDYFHVGENGISGPVHSLLGNPNLVYYNINSSGGASASVTGTPDFSNNILLEQISMSQADLSGILDVSNNPLLTRLDIRANEFGPALPDLSNNTSLTTLLMSANDFYGFIPVHYATLTSLTQFTAISNWLTVDPATLFGYGATYTNVAFISPAIDAWLTTVGENHGVFALQKGNGYGIDTDGDGFSDSVEYADELAGGSGNWNDSAVVPDDDDGDGVPNVIEVLDGTDENDATDYVDTDGDLVPDYIESVDGTEVDGVTFNGYIDTDGDGVPDYVEAIDGTDPNEINDYLDTDNGGVPDYIEEVLLPLLGLAATDKDDAADDNQDSDGDGVSDYIEILLGYPANNDSYTPSQSEIDTLGLSAAGGSSDSELADTGVYALSAVVIGAGIAAAAFVTTRLTKKS